MLTIGDLSDRTHVKVPTIRYYEQLGLLAEAERTAGNQRRYGPDEAKRLGFIKHARDLGFPIAAIRLLIALEGEDGKPCTGAHAIAEQQLTDVQHKIRQLQKLETELARISTAGDCDAGHTCNVLAALADHSQCTTEHDAK